MSGIWAVILAAGESKRMKMPKLLLQYNGKTIIETVIDNITKTEVNKTIVVTGAYQEEIQKVIRHSPVVIRHNDDFRLGMFSSVLCGLRSIPPDAEAVVVFPGDQPGIKPDVVNLLISSYRQTMKGIVIPVYRNERGHPVLIDIKYRSEIEKLKPEEGLRSLSYLFKDDVLEVETNTPSITKDIDTYEDYLNEINQKK
jgi:molybdenum cofactor cytidylyltransferase